MPKLIPVWLLIILCPSDRNRGTQADVLRFASIRSPKRAELKTIPAVDELLFKQVKKFKAMKNERKVDANGIPEHKVGRFPSRHNPNEVREQSYEFSLPLNPKPAREPIPLHNDTRGGATQYPFWDCP